MPRRRRRDYPGAWHHVMNRGVAKRTVFEATPDCRFFLACLARQVRAGLIEVHAYSLLTTHFHLLLRSPQGRLSRAMQRVLDAYARRFNRSRRRDGPLFRGRFTNRLVEDDDYLGTVVRYIDFNAVGAGLVSHPIDHPHGSARHYLSGRPPPWLTVEMVHDLLQAEGRGPDLRAAYARTFCTGDPGERSRWLVERALEGTSRPTERDEVLLRHAPPKVREWMRRKSLLADGTLPGVPLLHPADVLEAAARCGPVPGLQSLPAEVVACGALRLLSGLEAAEIAVRVGRSSSAVYRRLLLHRRALREIPEASTHLGRLLEEALRSSRAGAMGASLAPRSR